MLRNGIEIAHGSVLRQLRTVRHPNALRRASNSGLSKSPKPSTATQNPSALSATVSWTRLISSWVIGAFLGYHVFTSYFYSLPACEGISMLPTINAYGDHLLISKYYRRGRGVKVGDVVSYVHPIENWEGVKRVIGMEGDFVLRDTPGNSDVMLQIPKGHCWVVGDNLKYSRDSRHFGALPLALIKGKVLARISNKFEIRRLENGLMDVDDDGVE